MRGLTAPAVDIAVVGIAVSWENRDAYYLALSTDNIDGLWEFLSFIEMDLFYV